MGCGQSRAHAAAANSSAIREEAGGDPVPRQARQPWVRKFGSPAYFREGIWILAIALTMK